MNTSKVWAYVLAGVGIVLNVLQMIVPILPPQWASVVTALIGLATFYHIMQSHTPAMLAASGYGKMN